MTRADPPDAAGTAGPIVVAGEALVDLARGADGGLTPILGGGPFNTARAVARLGHPAAFVGCISRDGFGRAIAAALAADGVDLHPALRTDRPTSLAMAELDAQGRARYRFYMQGTSAEALEPSTAMAALPANPSVLHVGGVALALNPLAYAVEALVERLCGTTMVMVDPNMRPSLVDDPVRHSGRLWRLVAHADVLKLSDDDLRLMLPGTPPREAVSALLDRGPKLVLLTLGAEGAVAFGAFGSRTVAAPPVKVLDTIGAGDTFSGAWLVRWLELGRPFSDGEAVRDAVAFACRAAALSCSRRGASAPTRQELSAWPPGSGGSGSIARP